MRKRWLFSLLTLLVIPSALADTSSILSGVWEKIIYFGSLGGLDSSSAIVVLTRILIGFLVFTIFFAVTTAFSGQGNALGFLSRGQAGIVSAIIAIITVIFMPASVLLAVGSGWATLVSFILIGAPIVALTYTLWNINSWLGQDEDTRGTVFLKIILCLLLLFILNSLKYHVGLIAA